MDQLKDSSDIIYHYTDLNGLHGILRDRKLWCSHLAYLNDSDEYLLARKVYKGALKELAKEGSLLSPYAASALSRFSIGSGPQPGDDPLLRRTSYVACFSRKRDSLLLWRGYAGYGPRFSIGFRRSVLRKLEQEDPPFGVVDIVYVKKDDAQVRAGQLGTLRHEFSQLLRSQKSPETWDAEFWNETFSTSLVPTVKSRKFKAESEVRLYTMKGFSQDPKKILFRSKQSLMVPYIEAPLDKLQNLIASITVGPTPNRKEVRTAVVLAVARFQKEHKDWLGEPEVRMSKLTYRDW